MAGARCRLRGTTTERTQRAIARAAPKQAASVGNRAPPHEEERADTLIICERRRRGGPKRDCASSSKTAASAGKSRAAARRRRERRRLSSARDDEGGGPKRDCASSSNKWVRSLQAMELFDGLFDDETLFRGPEAHPLAQVVADHRELRAAYRSQLAALVVPDTQLTTVSRQLPTGIDLPVSVITTGGAGGLLALAGRDLPGIDIVSVEPALRDLDDLVGSAARVISAAAELGFDVDIFVTLPYAPGWEAAVEPIEAAGLYGKIDAGRGLVNRRTAVDLGRGGSAIQDHQSHRVGLA